jgi:radical SAM protein with 4Fe4S-binding SPASM domain
MNEKEFLIYRQQQDRATINAIKDQQDPMSSLLSVQFNTTELCNRTCIFCPRTDPVVYPNQNFHMSVDTIDKIAKDLASVGFVGRISLSGFGEPMLTQNFCQLVQAVKQRLPNNVIDLNTNGDRLNEDNLVDLFAAGISMIYVNLYDGPEQQEYFVNLFSRAGIPSTQYILRPHWPGGFQLILNNRSGLVENQITGHVLQPLKRSCYFPFSKAMIDWNGDLLLCPQDWGRNYVAGNLIQEHIRDVWLGVRLERIRKKLAEQDRSTSPCNRCNTDGMLTGEFGYQTLTQYYTKIDGATLPH